MKKVISIGSDIFYRSTFLSCNVLIIDNAYLKLIYPIKNKIDLLSLSDIEHTSKLIKYNCEKIKIEDKNNLINCVLSANSASKNIAKFTYKYELCLMPNITKIVFGQFINYKINPFYKTLYTIDHNKKIPFQCNAEEVRLYDTNDDFNYKFLYPHVLTNVKRIYVNKPISYQFIERFSSSKPDFYIPNILDIKSKSKIYSFDNEKKYPDDFGYSICSSN